MDQCFKMICGVEFKFFSAEKDCYYNNNNITVRGNKIEKCVGAREKKEQGLFLPQYIKGISKHKWHIRTWTQVLGVSMQGCQL